MIIYAYILEDSMQRKKKLYAFIFRFKISKNKSLIKFSSIKVFLLNFKTVKMINFQCKIYSDHCGKYLFSGSKYSEDLDETLVIKFIVRNIIVPRDLYDCLTFLDMNRDVCRISV